MRCVAVVVASSFGTFMWSKVHGEHVSAARRRRGATTHAVASARTSDRRHCLAESIHHAAPRGQKKARAGEGGASRTTRPRSGRPPFLSQSSSSCRSTKSPAGCGLTASLVSGRRSWYCGTLWSTSSTSLPSCRFSLCLCRRWGTNWWNS